MPPILLAATARMAALRLPVPGAKYDLPTALDWRLTSADSERLGRAAEAVLVLHDLLPSCAYRLEVEGLGEVTFTTTACAGAVCPEGLLEGADVADAGAARTNAAAFAAAIAAVPPGGALILPAGNWVTLPVSLRSDMTLHLSEGAVLQAPSVRDGWPILPARDATGQMLGSWEGLPEPCFAAPLHAIGATRLIIEGAGVIDGAGALGDWWTWPKGTRDGARRPRGLHLVNCRDVTLIGFGVRNAASWTVHPQGCDGLRAIGLRIEAPADSPNTDGFNPEMCRDVDITGVRFSVGDDCIAVKAGKRGPAGEADHLRETRGIRVRHCLMERGHGGLVIGSEMSGGVHDVSIEDCQMRGTDRGLRLKTRRGRGGAITGITMRRVLMERVQTAISANAHYHCDADGHDAWVQSRAPAAVGAGTPEIDGITVKDVTIDGLSHAAGCFLGLPEAPVRNVVIRNLHIRWLDPEAHPTPPVMADRIRPMRHEMIVAEHAEIDCDAPGLLSAAPVTLPDDEHIMTLTTYFDRYCDDYLPCKGGAWCYEDGCIYRGLVLLSEATGDPRWKAHLHRLADAQIGADGQLAGYDPKEFNIDNVLSGRILLPLARETADPRYWAAAERLIGQLDSHPRVRAGNYWHKLRYPDQVWLDGLYMALPFQIEYGLAAGEAARISDALSQFSTALALTETTGDLHVHGYDESRAQRWADPVTGRSPAVWARAMGWLAMALVDALVLLPEDAATRPLRARTRTILSALARRQAPSGLWPQVLDADALEGNYEESSASAMFSYALLRAARLGLGEGEEAAQWRAAGLRALDALTSTRLAEVDGTLRMTGICHVAGLGALSGPYRDGTPGYYLTEPIVSDDAKGVGPLMMAYAEAIRL